MQKFSIDKEEVLSILTSVIAISLSLTLASYGFELKSFQFLQVILIFIITVGSGFVFHELAHKFVAIKFGHYAKFVPWMGGLVLMLLLSFAISLFKLPLPLFLAPGAVMVSSNRGISKYENGVISAAGPITNILLAVVFFVLSLVYFLYTKNFESILFLIFFSGIKINLFLAFFNLLPIFPLDGSKVFAWNKMVWVILFIISLVGFVL